MRPDGRKPDDLRNPINLKIGVLNEADGSAYIEWGGNKILVGVFGPYEAPPYLEKQDRAILRVDYKMSTFCSLEEHGKYTPSRRSVEISKVLSEALSGIVMLDHYPGAIIDVNILVLQAEGGTRVASFYASVAALIEAGIKMKNIAYGISAGKYENEIVLDLSKEEDNKGQGDIPICLDRDENILLLQLDGKITVDEFKKALSMIKDKKHFFEQLLRKTLEDKYSKELRYSLVDEL
jgi:exosome complex component RRP41